MYDYMRPYAATVLSNSFPCGLCTSFRSKKGADAAANISWQSAAAPATVLTQASALNSDPANSSLLVRFRSKNLREARSEERESGGGAGDREDHGGRQGDRDQLVGVEGAERKRSRSVSSISSTSSEEENRVTVKKNIAKRCSRRPLFKMFILSRFL